MVIKAVSNGNQEAEAAKSTALAVTSQASVDNLTLYVGSLCSCCMLTQPGCGLRFHVI